MKDMICKRLNESIAVKHSIIEDEQLINMIVKLSESIIDCFCNCGKLLLCGNGGSAADALHFAGEIVGRFQKERMPWPAIVLNSDVATMTAIANDYGYDDIFARQTKAYITDKDVFIGISTSGNSTNVLKAVKVANRIGAKTAALLGNDGGEIGKLADYPIIIKCDTTARIQESHITIIHIICELVENGLCRLDHE